MGACREITELEKIFDRLVGEVRNLDKTLWLFSGTGLEHDDFPMSKFNGLMEDVDDVEYAFKRFKEEMSVLKEEANRLQVEKSAKTVEEADHMRSIGKEGGFRKGPINVISGFRSKSIFEGTSEEKRSAVKERLTEIQDLEHSDRPKTPFQLYVEEGVALDKRNLCTYNEVLGIYEGGLDDGRKLEIEVANGRWVSFNSTNNPNVDPSYLFELWDESLLRVVRVATEW